MIDGTRSVFLLHLVCALFWLVLWCNVGPSGILSLLECHFDMICWDYHCCNETLVTI